MREGQRPGSHPYRPPAGVPMLYLAISSRPIEAETEHLRARSGPSLETRGARGHAPEPGPGHARAREAARATANPRRGPRMAGRDQEPGPPEGGGRAPLFLAGAR